MRKNLRYIAASLGLLLCLSGCAREQTQVPVERVDALTSAAITADRFAGVVVSDNTVSIPKELDKSISELLVKEGDQVQQGTKLFSYDSDELKLNLEKQELELDRHEAEIESIETQIKEVNDDIAQIDKNKSNTDTNAKTQLNIQLRQLETELTQAEYDEAALKTEIDYTKEMLNNIDVYSPIDGTIRSIDEESYEEYIVIQQAGAYKVKGLLNEINMGMGIMEGVTVQITSRLNPEQVWTGVVDLVDYENAEQNSVDTMYYGVAGEGMTNSSSYPFYVTLDSTEGLLLGQHVYIQQTVTTPAADMVCVPENYLMDLLYTPESDSITAAVWAVGIEGTLEKRPVTLGEYDTNTGSYQVLEGLDFTDYVADPTNSGCKEGAAVSIQGGNSSVDDNILPSSQESVDPSETFFDEATIFTENTVPTESTAFTETTAPKETTNPFETMNVEDFFI